MIPVIPVSQVILVIPVSQVIPVIPVSQVSLAHLWLLFGVIQAGVLLSIEKAKFWPFWSILAILSRRYALLGVLLQV